MRQNYDFGQDLLYPATPVVTTVREKIVSLYHRINAWMDGKSTFYSSISGFAVTRRTALHIGIVLPASLTVGVACAESCILISLAALVTCCCILGKERAYHEK